MSLGGYAEGMKSKGKTMSSPKETRAQILKQAFERAQKQNRAFSLRALAKKLGVSAPFVSKVLSGKTDLPFERVADFVLHLKMDKISENRLVKSYADTKIEKMMGLQPRANSSTADVMEKYVEIGEKQFFLLSRWYYIAILDLSACKGFSDSPEWVAKKMRMTVPEADQALRFLKAQNYLIQDANGAWVKNEEHLRFPTKESRDPIRAYHELMMKKAIHHLQTRTSQEDFNRRLISGIWIGANPANFEKAMDRLNEAMYEAAQILSEGECSEVYYLSSQLFPVTRSEER